MPGNCLKPMGLLNLPYFSNAEYLLSIVDKCNLRQFLITKSVTFRIKEQNILEDFKTIVYNHRG